MKTTHTNEPVARTCARNALITALILIGTLLFGADRAGAITSVTITTDPSPAVATRPASTFNVTLNGITANINNNATVVVAFPLGTVVPSDISATINGVAVVTLTVSGTQVTMTNPSVVNRQQVPNPVISFGPGIRHTPSSGTGKEVTVTVAGTRTGIGAYDVDAATTSITGLDVSASPLYELDTNLEWTWTFTTSAEGYLVAENYVISLVYPDETTFTGTILPSHIAVNGNPPSAVDVVGKTVEITVGADIDVSTLVTVVVTADAGIQGTTLSPLSYSAYTDSDPSPAVKADFSLPVEMAEMTAELRNGRVLLSWRTESEIENLGFHIWRSETAVGPYERVTNELIPGLGTSPFGKEYTWTDGVLIAPGVYFYKIQDVAWDGRTEMHGPIEITVGAHDIPRFSL